MKRFAVAFIFFPISALAQQAAPPVQALGAMLQECEMREANARVGVATLQSDLATLKAVDEDLKTQLRTAQSHAVSVDPGK